jgi:glutaredoxin 3
MFTVYSKPACPACDTAKALLKQRGLDFSEVVLDVGQPKVEGKTYIDRQALLTKFPTARTVPQIMHGDRHIGGLHELTTAMALNEKC